MERPSPSSSEPSSGRTFKDVPLVIYNASGIRTRIGEATVTEKTDGYHVETRIDAELAADLGLAKGPFSIGAHAADKTVFEVAAVPLPKVKHVCPGTDDKVICHQGTVYGFCLEAECPGGCEKHGPCPCSCHKKESNGQDQA